MTDYITLTEDEVKVLRAKWPTLNDSEWAAFVTACNRYELDPNQNQIYPRITNEGTSFRRLMILTQIDGFRLIAERTGLYAGSDDAVFTQTNAMFKSQGDEDSTDIKATVTVYKMVEGQRCAFSASAMWSEYYSDSPGFAAEKPHIMLAKCAESQALRKAFPSSLGGLYTTDEMRQADRTKEPQPPGANIRDVPEMPATPAPTEKIIGIDEHGRGHAVDLNLDSEKVSVPPETTATIVDFDLDSSDEIKPLKGARKLLASELAVWTGREISEIGSCIRPLAWAVGIDHESLDELGFTKLLLELRAQVNAGASWVEFEAFCSDKMPDTE